MEDAVREVAGMMSSHSLADAVRSRHATAYGAAFIRANVLQHMGSMVGMRCVARVAGRHCSTQARPMP